MKKIILIQPKSPETFWKLTGWLNVTKEKALVPPLALVTVAALTPPEYEIKIVDGRGVRGPMGQLGRIPPTT